MIRWKTVKMSWDRARRTIILHRVSQHTRATKYINTKEELGRWQWFLEEVWNAKFRWDPNVLNSLGERGAIVRIGEDRLSETLAEKRP